MNILEIKKMNFCYKQQFILNNFTLSIKEGSIYGLLGKPKSGKTTALKIILGLLKSKTSSVYMNGADMNGTRDKIREAIGDIIDLPYYQNYLTVRENFKYIDMLYSYSEIRIMEMMKFVGLSDYADQKVRKLSHVQKQCLSIGLALYHNPKLLVFDDLLKGIDKEGRIEITKLLLKIKGLGKTILLTSREYEELSSVCTHIGVLDSGFIVKERLNIDFMSTNIVNRYTA